MPNDLSLLHAARKPAPHRHRMPITETLEPGGIITKRYACGHDYDPVRARLGRNNRARGGRAELSVAREYGGEKVGPLALPEDIRGRVYGTQVKTHVGVPPIWYVKPPAIRYAWPSPHHYVWVCSDVLGSGWMAYAPDRWEAIFEALETGERTPRLIERWKPGQGIKPVDWVIVRRHDEPNDPEAFSGHYVAWSGFDWLDRYGKDE